MDKSQQPQAWSSLGTDEQNALMAEALVTAFRLFRRTTVPRVSLTPAILYLSIFLLTERETMATPLELTKWLSSPRSLEGRRYEVRLSARENESYLIITSA
jgi:hypothetical protein